MLPHGSAPAGVDVMKSYCFNLQHGFMACTDTAVLFYRRHRKLANPDYYLRHVRASVCLSVRMEQLGSHRSDLGEIWYEVFFRKSVEKIQVRQE